MDEQDDTISFSEEQDIDFDQVEHLAGQVIDGTVIDFVQQVSSASGIIPLDGVTPDPFHFSDSGGNSDATLKMIFSVIHTNFLFKVITSHAN